MFTQMSSENIFTCTNPFLVFLKLFGLFPFTLNKKNEFKTKASDFAITFFVVTTCVCLDIFSMTEFFIYEIGSEILKKVWIFTSALSAVLHFLLFVHQLRKCREISSIITSLHKVDLKVDINNII